jgi:mRNA-degrading endonuclease RelE of RelBE toxin-antitoxin system
MKLLEFIETSIFTHQINSYLNPDEYEKFQEELMANPKKGMVIPGSGGMRKIMVAGQGRGKRGGARVIYYLVTKKGVILLLFAYPKNVQDDLDASQLTVLRKVAEELENNG